MARAGLKSLLLGCVSATAMAPVAFAQTADESTDTTDEIIVRGFRSSIESSIATKRNETSIVEAVTAEDIGKLPDVSIAEALGRLPGLATQRLDGRASVLSIRGLGPDFSTTLLNGREQVSVGDNRGVEFDQYPSELIESAVVYKTPFAGLVGQGLAGTVDLRTVRPLEKGKRILSGNARYEWNDSDTNNPDLENKGHRASFTYVDQFADDTVGIALGVSYQNTPTQTERFNAWGYPSVYRDAVGGGLTGGSTSTDDNGTPGDTSDDVTVDNTLIGLVPGGMKPFAQTNELKRLGLVGIFEFQPTEKFSTAVDVYYSDFEEERRLRGLEIPLWWSSAQLVDEGANFEIRDVDGIPLIASGSFTNVHPVMRNDVDLRETELFAIGWNATYQFSDVLSFEFDASYSSADREDELIESYSGIEFQGASGSNGDTIQFDISDDGVVFVASAFDYSDPANVVLTDPQGWGGGNNVVQAGFINNPATEDELSHIKFIADREFGKSWLASAELGMNFSKRTKERVFLQNFLTFSGIGTDPLAGAVTEITAPQAALLGQNAAMDFIGFGPQLTYDPLYLLDNNVYELVSVAGSSLNFPQDWSVEEKVFQTWLRAEIDTTVGNIPLTGNFGVQYVHTDQSSSGVRIQNPSGVVAGTTGATVQSVSDGDEYSDVLPSLNLIFALNDDTQLRFGAARTLVRPRMDDLNASLNLSTNQQFLTNTEADLPQTFFGANGGNPQLRPYTANSFDLSLERYFGNAGYVSFGIFYKELEDYINGNDGFITDFSEFVDSELTAAEAALLGTTLGAVSGPRNNGEGHIQGAEFAFSLPLDTFSEHLEGFGVIHSTSYTDSEVKLGDAAVEITVPGLSEWVANTTVYYERGGFEARVSQRYRSEFFAEVAGISANRILRGAQPESIFDAQIGYRFDHGPMEGLNIFLQGNNLTDEPFTTFNPTDVDLSKSSQDLVIDDQRFGRSFLIGASFTY